ncbi:MAG: hypothetical protein EBU66_19625, partial [Bacteroidetes bacterium]|nr:hypothetical protein [Bacteroidota bacterium]
RLFFQVSQQKSIIDMLKSNFEDFVEQKNIFVEVAKFGKYKNIHPNFQMFLLFCGANLMDPEIGMENLKNDSSFVNEFCEWYKEQGL